MTRLLVPEMFGVMALVQVFIYILAMISDVGISPNIIRSSRGNDQTFLNTAWTIQVLRGAAICLILVAFAYYIGYWQSNADSSNDSAFSHPDLSSIILVMSVAPLISGFRSTNIILANRSMLLGKVVTNELLSQVLSLLGMLVWAYLSPSVWALVFGAIVNSISIVILSHVFFPGEKNRFRFEMEGVREIIGFGKWVLLSSLVTALLNQGDRLIFGTLISAEMLGIYSIAVFLAAAVSDAFMTLNQRVFFPYFSELSRSNAQSIKGAYYKVRMYMDAVYCFSAGFLFSFGPTLVSMLYDPRYQDAGSMLSVLSLAMLLKAPATTGAVYLALGKPNYVTAMVTIESVVKLSLIVLLFQIGGLSLAIWAVALFTLSIIPIDIYYKKKLGILDLKREFLMLPLFFVGYFLAELIIGLF